MLKIKKLNQAGFAHHFLLAAAVIVIGVASFGAYQLVASHADTYSAGSTITIANSRGCFDAGRNWDTTKNTCAATCRTGAGTWKNGYCDNAVAPTIGRAQCNSLHRIFVASYGCARRADQATTANAPQCQTGYTTYVNAGIDYCKTVAVATPSPTPRPAAPTPPAPKTTTPVPTTASKPTYDTTAQLICLRNGRNYSAGHGCETSCTNPAAGTYKKDSKDVGYCSNAYTEVSLVNQAKCSDLNRVWSLTVPGCARDYHEMASPSNTLQCLSGFPKYIPGVTGKNFAYCEKTGTPDSKAIPVAAHDTAAKKPESNNKQSGAGKPKNNSSQSSVASGATKIDSVSKMIAFCHSIPTGGRHEVNGSCGTCLLAGYVWDGMHLDNGYNTCVKQTPIYQMQHISQSVICRAVGYLPNFCHVHAIPAPVINVVKFR